MKKSIIISSLLIIIFLLGGYFYYTMNHFKHENTEKQVSSITAPSLPKKEVNLNEINDNKELILVNKDFALKTVPDKSELTNINGFPILTKAGKAVTNLIEEVSTKVGGVISLNSGFRDSLEQANLYDTATDKSFVQIPGHSEHETGLAADIAVRNVSNVMQSPESKALRSQAWKYGLIVRYPADKVEITGISNEPWHFRYVGKVHAYYMKKHNLALEEYISTLKQKHSYQETIDGKKYFVFYETPKNGTISVPNTYKYTVSSDNTGGYIVTTIE